ncbi:formyl transferase [Russula compacta]|nr:formyl transferase [Russula compacta]
MFFRRLHRLARQYHNLSSPPQRFDILYFGRDEFSCTVFETLYCATDVWQNLLIATLPDQMIGRMRDVLSVSPLKTLGNKLNVPVTTIPHIRSELKTWTPPLPFYPLVTSDTPPSNHLLLTASFGRILPSSLLSLFRPTHTLNVHPSALPAYRGPAPIQRAILNGERDTEVCVIEMKRRGGIDAGDILGRVPVSIPPGIAYGPLRDTLARKGGELLVSVSAPSWMALKSVSLRPNFARETAEDVVRRHLALSHHKPLTTYLPSTTRTVQIHDPSVFPSSAGDARTVVGSQPGSARYHNPLRSVLVRCAEGSVLRVPMLKSEFRSLVPAKSWWDGIQPHWKDPDGCILFTSPPPADHSA